MISFDYLDGNFPLLDANIINYPLIGTKSIDTELALSSSNDKLII